MSNPVKVFEAGIVIALLLSLTRGQPAHANNNPGANGASMPPVVDLVSGNCPRQCHRQGVCTLGTCRCYHGYKGHDCGVTVTSDGIDAPHSWQPIPDYRPQDDADMRAAARLPCDNLLGAGRDTLGIWQLCTARSRLTIDTASQAVAAEGTGHEHSLSPSASSSGRPTSARAARRLRICLVSSHVMHTPLDVEDLGVGLPAAPLATLLAAAGHEVTVLLAMFGAAYLAHANEWKHQLKDRHNITLVPLHHTRHYYLSPELAHAFEVFAWLVDERSRGAPHFDVVHFHDGHGLGYYTTLAKHQNVSEAGLSATALIVSVDLPSVYLATQGGGTGLEALETLEIDHIERESARLADMVLFHHHAISEWCLSRRWRLSGAAWVLPRAVTLAMPAPSPVQPGHLVGHLGHGPRDGQAPRDGPPASHVGAAGTEHSTLAASRASKHRLVFLLEGPGGPLRGPVATGGSRKAGLWGTGVGEQVSQRTSPEMARHCAESAHERAAVDAVLATASVELLESWVSPSHGAQPEADGWPAHVDSVLFVALGNMSRGVADAVVASSDQRHKVTFAWSLQRSLLHERLLGGFLRDSDIVVLVAAHHRGMRTLTTLRLLAQACVHHIVVASPAALSLLQQTSPKPTDPTSQQPVATWVAPRADAVARALRALLEPTTAQGGDAPGGRAARPCQGHWSKELQLLRRWLHFYDSEILPMVPSGPPHTDATRQPTGGSAPTAQATAHWQPQGLPPAESPLETSGASCGAGDPTDNGRMCAMPTRISEASGAVAAGFMHETSAAVAHAHAAARHVAWLAAQGLPHNLVPGSWGASDGAGASHAGSSIPQGWWESSPPLTTGHPPTSPSSSRWSGVYVPLVSVIMTHFNRHTLLRLAVLSIASQDYPRDRLQLVLVDDGSTDAEVPPALDAIAEEFKFAERGWLVLREPNRYLGGARNVGVLHARGEYLMFVDDDNYAKPHEVSTFVRAMESSGADVLTSFVDFITEKSQPQAAPGPMGSQPSVGAASREVQASGLPSPSFVFLGGSAEVGLFKNCFGDANSFFRASSFLLLGKYTEDKGVGYEDWEIYAKAALQGYTLEIVPLALYHYRFTAGSMQKNTSYSESRKRALRAYTQQLSEAVE